MELRVVKTLWGVDDAAHPERWPALFARIKAEGFSAIEAHIGTWRRDKAAFSSALEAAGLQLIAQVHTTAVLEPNFAGYRYMTSRKLEDHLESLDALVAEAKEMGAVLVNSHSGCDCWGVATVRTYLRGAQAVAQKHEITISHETHRRRILYSPFAFRDALMSDDGDTSGLEGVRVTADLSHWVVICERCFGNPADVAANGDDEWWAPTLAEVAKRCALVHARVGFAEGPQVPHPAAPEYEGEVNAHMDWWAAIWNERAKAGDAIAFAEPEFGPAPYCWALPYTKTPLADIWEVNGWMAKRLKERYLAEELYE